MKFLKIYTQIFATAVFLCICNNVFAQCTPTSDLKVNLENNTATATWTAIMNAIGYEYGVTTNENPPVSAGTFTTSNSFVMPGLTPDKKYCIYVRTRCNDVNNPISEWTKSCGVTPCTDEMPDITKLEINNDNPAEWLAQWTLYAPAGGGYSYAITQSEDEPNQGSLTPDTSVLIGGLKSATKYCLHVRYYCPNSRTHTKWAVKCFTTPEASGVNSIDARNSINISPNPAGNVVNISMPSIRSIHTIVASDITGRVVYNMQTASENIQLNTSDLTQGMYFIHISGKEYNTTRKLLVQY